VPLPALNTQAAPLHDNADQTTFLTQFIQDSNHLGPMATTIETNGDPAHKAMDWRLRKVGA
jgi:hypothetical protein